MAQINKNPALMALPSGIKRGVAAALDSTSVWYNYDLMSAYAQGGDAAIAAGVAVTAYVGQVLTLVNEAEKTATAYVIMDAEGTLQEVGSATLGDEKTISLTDGVLGLKNWGVQYYKWVDSEIEGEEGKHVLQVVDADNPWIAGLEPKATTTTDGTIEIAWYQPSTTTIEGVSSAIASVQNTVDNLSKGIGSVEDAAGTNTVYGAINEIKEENTALEETIASKLDAAGGTMTGDLILSDGSKAASETAVDTKIASAIDSAGHLKRDIVEYLPEVDVADPDIIYMVQNTAGTYNEYILINGAFELIGDTAVDLTPYMKKIEGATADNFVKLNADGEVIDAGINETNFVSASDFDTYKNEIISTLDEKVNAADETYTSLTSNAEKLANLPVFSAINSDTGLSIVDGALTLAVSSSSSSGAMSAEQAAKLENITAGAQPNVIEGALLGSTGVEVNIDENKKLVLPIAGAFLGLVKSSDADNGITIAEDGTMSINRIATNKLYVADGDEFILNGGNA